MYNRIIRISIGAAFMFNYAIEGFASFAQDHDERVRSYREMHAVLAEEEEAFRGSLGSISAEIEWEAIREWRLERAGDFAELEEAGRQIASAMNSATPAPVEERTYSESTPEETRLYLVAKDEFYREELADLWSASDGAQLEWDAWQQEHAEELKGLCGMRSDSRAAMVNHGGYAPTIVEYLDHPEMHQLYEGIQKERRQLRMDSADWSVEEKIAARLALHRTEDQELNDLFQQLEEEAEAASAESSTE